METDAARPKRFAGLSEHLEHHAGRRTGSEPDRRGFAMAFYAWDDEGTVTVVSDGLRDQPLTTLLEQELVCTLLAGQADAARQLVGAACAAAIRRGEGLEYDSVLDHGEPLVDGTLIHGAIASAHPYFDEEFDLFRDTDGNIQLQLLTLVPVTRAELVFAAKRGVDELRQRWSDAATNVLDVRRDSVI